MYSYDDRMRAVKLYIQYARHLASSTTNDERLTMNPPRPQLCSDWQQVRPAYPGQSDF